MSKSNINRWWPRDVNKYRTDTGGLSLAEHGAYALLLDEYYLTEKPLPANAQHLHRICRALADEERNAVDKIITMFFTKKGDEYHNKTANEELRKRKDISSKRAKAANKKHCKSTCKTDANAPTNADTIDINNISTNVDIPPLDTPPPKTEKKNGKTKSLPVDWQPNFKHLAKCQALGFNPEQLAEQFRDYHTAKGSKFANWDSAFNNWIRNAEKFRALDDERKRTANGRGSDVVGATLRARQANTQRAAQG